MEQGSEGSTHSNFIVDGEVSCLKSFMISDVINENISKTRTNKSSAWNQGTRWRLWSQSHFDSTPDDT